LLQILSTAAGLEPPADSRTTASRADVLCTKEGDSSNWTNWCSELNSKFGAACSSLGPTWRAEYLRRIAYPFGRSITDAETVVCIRRHSKSTTLLALVTSYVSMRTSAHLHSTRAKGFPITVAQPRYRPIAAGEARRTRCSPTISARDLVEVRGTASLCPLLSSPFSDWTSDACKHAEIRIASGPCSLHHIGMTLFPRPTPRLVSSSIYKLEAHGRYGRSIRAARRAARTQIGD